MRTCVRVKEKDTCTRGAQNYLEKKDAAVAFNDRDGDQKKVGQATHNALLAGNMYTVTNWAATAKQILKTANLFVGATAGARLLGAEANGDGSLSGNTFWTVFKVGLRTRAVAEAHVQCRARAQTKFNTLRDPTNGVTYGEAFTMVSRH